MPKQALSAATKSVLSRSGSGDSLKSNTSQTKQHESVPTSLDVSRLWSKLNKSGCPFVENLDEQSVNDILKPCDLRIRILHWILISVGVEEKALLQPVKNHKKSADDVEYLYQNILKIVDAVAPIRNLDLDLVMGKAGSLRQINFFCLLLDTIIQKNTYILPQDDTCSVPASSSQLEEDFHRNCNLIDALLESGAMTELASLHFRLPDDKCLPEELQPEKNTKRKSTECLKNTWSPTQYLKVQEDLNNLEDELQQQTLMFTKLHEEISYAAYDKDDVFVAIKKLNLEVQELKEATTAFNEGFKKDLKMWCSCAVSEPSPLDPLMANLHANTEKIAQFCKSLSTIRAAFNKINTDLKAKLTTLLGKKDDDIPASFRQWLPEWIDVLHEAITLENTEDAKDAVSLLR